MKSDFDKWFICMDGSNTAIKCRRERLIDALRDSVGPERASVIFPLFRRATFAESCKFELELIEG